MPGYSAEDIRIVEGQLWTILIPCETIAPDFVAGHASVFERYRLRHAAALAHLQAKRGYAEAVKHWRTPEGSPTARAVASITGKDAIIPRLVRYSRQPDPRLFSAQGSWDFLKASLADANRADALLVVSPNDERFVRRVGESSDKELRMAADRMGSLEIIRSWPDRLVAKRKEVEGWHSEVYFEKIFGEWHLTQGVEVPFAR